MEGIYSIQKVQAQRIVSDDYKFRCSKLAQMITNSIEIDVIKRNHRPEGRRKYSGRPAEARRPREGGEDDGYNTLSQSVYGHLPKVCATPFFSIVNPLVMLGILLSSSIT